MEKLKKLNKDKARTEDELHDCEDEVQKITDKYVKEIDDMAKKKEADLSLIHISCTHPAAEHTSRRRVKIRKYL